MRQGRRRRITGLIFAAPRRLAISAAVKPKPDSCTSSSAASQPRIRSLAGSSTAATSLRTRLDCAFGEPRRAQTARCFEKRFAEPCIFVKLPCRSHRVPQPGPTFEKPLSRDAVACRFRGRQFRLHLQPFECGRARRQRAFANDTCRNKHRHCERSEAIQNLSAERFWIASSQGLLAMTWRGRSSTPPSCSQRAAPVAA